MASLRDTQRAFAAALRARDDDSRHEGPSVQPAANLGVYRNNAEWQFRNALSLSFPVLRRRVGDDFFRQLAFHYRARFPSRSGDLHWVGRDFAAFLATHLAGGDYAWLADLASLEWAREQASIAATQPAEQAAVLAGFASEDLAQLVFQLQPSVYLGKSDFPVVSVWRANQVENAPPLDQSLSGENYLVHGRDDNVEIVVLDTPLFMYLAATRDGAVLGDAMSIAGLDETGLVAALQFMFAHGLVTRVARAEPHSANR